MEENITSNDFNKCNIHFSSYQHIKVLTMLKLFFLYGSYERFNLFI